MSRNRHPTRHPAFSKAGKFFKDWQKLNPNSTIEQWDKWLSQFIRKEVKHK